MMLMTDIHIRSFTGSGLKPYLHSCAKLRMEVFKDYPYFVNPDLDQQLRYLRHICTSKETIAVLIFDNTTLVGVSLGYPLDMEDPALLRSFKERNISTESYYYFEASALLKSYRGRGMGHHFFDAREAHVAGHKKYKHICICVPDISETDPNRPKDFVPLFDFWRKRGFIHHPEIKSMRSWQNIHEDHPTQHPMSIWIKGV